MITAISANDISVCSVIKEESVHCNRFSIETQLLQYKLSATQFKCLSQQTGRQKLVISLSFTLKFK